MVSTMRRKLAALTIRPVGDELLLLDTDAQRIHQLNATASFIWQCCGKTASADEIAGLVATEYVVEQHIALRDVAETLDRLRELNLIVEC